MNKTKLKICGITQKNQGIAIAELGVDALGFILYKKSPRYIAPPNIKQIVFDLPPFTKTVGVFVNESITDIVSIVKASGIDLVQLSGDETAYYCQELTNESIPWIKSFRVKNQSSIKDLRSFQNRYILLDAWSDKGFGGTGNVFDWSILKEAAVSNAKLVLAGGINAGNVSEAIKRVNPYAIDVSSGVETSPGVKSLEKVIDFIQAMSI